MKVCHFSKKFSSQNKLILNIQSSIELSQIQGILSNYSEVFLFFAKYGFLFENVSLETESSKSKHAPVESTLSTPAPVRDGSNWFGYAGQNPINNVDPNGLAFYGPDGVHSIYDDPYVAPDMNNKNENPTGPNEPTETPKVPETPRETDTTQPNDLNCDLFAAGYDNEGNLWLFFIIDGVYKSQKAKIKKQNEIERKYGYTNLLCYVTSTLNMYISDGVVKESFIDNDLGKILEKHLNNDKKSKNYGALDDFNHFSNDIAKALGLDRYYEFIYKNKQEMKLFSEEEFYNLKRPDNSSMLDYGKYGIGWFHNSSVPEHHMLYRKETRDRINPSNNDNYTLDYIQPVFSQIINLF